VHLEGQFFHCQAQRAQLLGDVQGGLGNFGLGGLGPLDALLCREAVQLVQTIVVGGDARKALGLQIAVAESSVGILCMDL
jgi:hypothetical protein